MIERRQPKVKSLGKALNLLSLFTTEHAVWGVSELAQQMGVTKSNAHNIVSTFCDLGYLRRTHDGRYTLGLKMLEFAFHINQNLGYPTAVYDIMVDAAAKTNEIVYFGLPYGTNVLYLYVVHPAARMGQLVAGLSASGPTAAMTDEKLMECVGILRDAAMRMRERIYH